MTGRSKYHKSSPKGDAGAERRVELLGNLYRASRAKMLNIFHGHITTLLTDAECEIYRLRAKLQQIAPCDCGHTGAVLVPDESWEHAGAIRPVWRNCPHCMGDGNG